MGFFKIKNYSGAARTGVLSTGHGTVNTPSFIPVATHGVLNCLNPDEIKKIGVQIMISNTLHTHLQPGENLVEEMGGLHDFMGWNGPLMTDSGGFQAFSLGPGKSVGLNKAGPSIMGKKGKILSRIDNDGINFISYIDGSSHFFTPEKCMEIQAKLAPDIFLVLDECTACAQDYDYTKKAMERTHLWAEKSLDAFNKLKKKGQLVFGIVQGGLFQDLREESSRLVAGLDVDGCAIGGCLGPDKKEMFQVAAWANSHLPVNQPKHLLGIGEIEDILMGVDMGLDLFDCVLPTRLARTGTFLVKDRPRFRLHITNKAFTHAKEPIESDCPCLACKRSKSYIRHLFKIKEPLGFRLACIHNLMFMEKLMSDIRGAIDKGRWDKLKKEWGQ